MGMPPRGTSAWRLHFHRERYGPPVLSTTEISFYNDHINPQKLQTIKKLKLLLSNIPLESLGPTNGQRVLRTPSGANLDSSCSTTH